jgi:hypothetical protein
MGNNFQARLRQWIRSWRTEDCGSFTTLGIIVLSLSILAGGAAIDVSRYESYRTEVQYNLDRAVLAAASLRQTKEPKAIVENYLNLIGVSPDSISVPNPITTVTRRWVKATVEQEFETMFLKMVGFTTLTILAEATAEEIVPNLEISLAIDVSGSMDGSRMSALRPAAKDFITQILASNSTETNATELETHRAYFNLIPYAGEVVAGQPMFDTLVSNRDHSKSHCVDFDRNVDYTVTALEHAVGIDFGQSTDWGQSPHFSIWGDSNPISDPWCETDEARVMAVASKDEFALHAQIDALDPFGNTSIDIAMKWAVGLLDPNMQAVLTALSEQDDEDESYVSRQHVSSGFLGHPSNYSDTDTQKVIVLMTDGENTSYYRMREEFATDLPSGEAWYSEDNNRWSSYQAGYNEYYITPGRFYDYEPYGDDAEEQTWAVLWDTVSFLDYWNTINPFPNYTKYLEYTTGSTKNVRMEEICDAARDAGIIVFTIGFEAPSTGQESMEECATTTSHYYDANVSNLEEVFGKIAANIHKLKLVD